MLNRTIFPFSFYIETNQNIKKYLLKIYNFIYIFTRLSYKEIKTF